MTSKQAIQSDRPQCNKQGRNKQGGYIQGVLVIIVVLAIITVGILRVGFSYFTNAKVSNEITFAANLAAHTKSYAAQAGLFDATTANLAALVGRGFFPSNQVNGVVVTNQYRGLITVAVGTINTAGDSLDFTGNNIPVDDCKQIGTGLDGIAARVTINGTVTKAVGAATVPATVDGACTGTNNVIIYNLAS